MNQTFRQVFKVSSGSYIGYIGTIVTAIACIINCYSVGVKGGRSLETIIITTLALFYGLMLFNLMIGVFIKLYYDGRNVIVEGNKVYYRQQGKKKVLEASKLEFMGFDDYKGRFKKGTIYMAVKDKDDKCILILCILDKKKEFLGKEIILES